MHFTPSIDTHLRQHHLYKFTESLRETLLLIFMLLTLMPETAVAAKTHQNEQWYQEVWCQGMGGKVEVRLEDGRRIDCLTKTHAIEVEFANKWPEAIGQSLDYGMLTNKKAGVVLILKKPSDQQHWDRLNKVINYYQLPIQPWKLGP